jgi:hypothetical protein
MHRSLAALALATLVLSGPALAQEAVPAQPAPGQTTIDPLAAPNQAPISANLLTGFYATQAVIELCNIVLDPGIAAGMDADRLRLERSVGLDTATAAEAYSKVKAEVESTEPDCTLGSEDLQSVDAITAIYAAQASSSTDLPGTTAAPAAPAATPEPATPAPPADATAPATPTP